MARPGASVLDPRPPVSGPVSFLESAVPIITEHGYGFFPGGDPRRFSPDGDSRPEELENHRLACEAWDRGEQESSTDCTHAPGVIVTRCQFGLGMYEWDEEVGWGDWLRHYVLPSVRGAVWRWWAWEMVPGMCEAWHGEGR